MFLQQCGRRYDENRKMKKFSGSKEQREEVLTFFRHRCCYCGTSLGEGGEEAHLDHLVAMNRKDAGLHSWGNVVCACTICNRRKSSTDWEKFLTADNNLGGKREVERRQTRINAFIAAYRYAPDTEEIQAAAQDLYREVSKVAKALVDIKVERHLGGD